MARRKGDRKATAASDGPDRRSARRFEVNWPVTLRGTEPGGRDVHEEGSIANLSSTGAFVNLTRRIKVGTKLEVKIDLPLKKKNFMQYSAEVIRVDRRTGVAVKFDTPKPVFASR